MSVISFGFGYFLFRSQTKEQMRLEIYRRKLDSYEKIICFFDELDRFAHKYDSNGFYPKDEKEKLIQYLFKLTAEVQPYVALELVNLLTHAVHKIDFLPDSLADLEVVDTEITEIIHRETGTYVPNWWTQVMSELGNKRK